jgi:hypothetical protein
MYVFIATSAMHLMVLKGKRIDVKVMDIAELMQTQDL